MKSYLNISKLINVIHHFKLKKNNYMIIRIDTERHFLKKSNIHFFRKLENFLSLMKGVREKSTANMIFNSDRMNINPKIRSPAWIKDSFQHCTKGCRREEVKLLLFSDNMIIQVENPIKSTQKPLELTSECSKVEGDKINQYTKIHTMKLICMIYSSGYMSLYIC